ncbi:putative HTH-type transcriptional regulator [Actinobacillus porcinus]|uniref:HTH-type transcriptional regulator n=1 Tax=Actinobacillus porcinus TaxID=51048 RepID=A0ABY6TM84_9PAST|nr:LysR family transcriptional regulator [Actinobacillus porcinus]VFY94037.1 putative HTH-type transcriptional regulator [Actinobacillus porcinus]VTU09639.1 putative HTH-type transcriptional regulator [Actinobacillus porcinus]
MDRIEAMNIFLTVVETGSFTTTADRLDLSRPMVTRAVALVEEWFNARLLQRTTRRVSLTSAGERAVTHCQKMVDLAAEIEQDILAQQGELQGSLRIASNSSFGSTHLLLAIKDFLQRHPKLNIQFQLSDQSVNLIDERIDLAIRFTNQPDPNLIARPLATCHSLLVASPEYLAQKGVPQTPQDLAEHIYLAHANINRKEWKFYQNEREISLELTSQFTTNDTGALLNLTLAGGGIAMLPKYLLNEHLASQQLVPILTDWQLPTYQIYALYSSRHKLPLTIRTLVDFLVERFRGVSW